VKLSSLAWGPVHAQLFRELQQHQLIKLSHYDPERKLCLYADASMTGWGAVLTQVPMSDMSLPHTDRDHQPLAFISGCFRGASCNWSIIEKEAFALIRALTATDYFCQTEKGVVIYTDHRNLVYLFDPMGAEPGMHRHTAAKLLRWGARLSAFNYVIEHISSTDNCWADLLTRWGASPPDEHSVKRLLASGIIDDPRFDSFPRAEDISRAQTAAVKRNSAIPRGFAISNALYRSGELVWIPEDRELIVRLLVVAHAGRGGHRGREATKAILKERFYMEDLDQYVRTFVQECLHCQWSSQKNESRPLRSQIHGTRLNQVIHFDFLYLGLTESVAYVLIIKEDISGYIWLIPCEEPTADVVVDALTNWFSTFGVAEVWVSDQGSHFRNQVMDRLRQTLNVKHRFTQPYCAWSNGTVERVCREILRLLRAWYSEEPGRSLNDWPQLVKLCQLTLNGTHRVSLGTTPMHAFIGLKDSPIDAVFSGSCDIDTVSWDQMRTLHKHLIDATIKALADLHTKSIEKRTSERAMRVKAHNERTNVIDAQFVVGDFVLVAADIKGAHSLQKLAVRWKGPCRVLRAISSTTYEIESLVDGKCETLHYAHLRRYSDASLNVTQFLKASIAGNESKLHEYKVQRLLDLRKRASVWEVLVQWNVFKEPTWEPASVIRDDVPEIFKDFLETKVPAKVRRRFVSSRVES
jgi:hypothetical protein